ncbi:MAG: radical SAM protein [Paludibacteraceae bacterium]|nr:radical SAM protein [Paludibacteraceae bacterium]
MSNDIYFRPPWTCGRYNADKHVAIVFNALTHCEYFFEEESADVMGLVLEAGRGGMVTINELSVSTNISFSSIAKFFVLLQSLGLLSDVNPTDKVINEYRRECISHPSLSNLTKCRDKDESKTTARLAYIDAVKENSLIFDAVFELTYRCSEKCIHCYNPGATRNDNEESGRGNLTELSLEDYKRIIDEMYDEGLVMVELTGGDPFSNKYVWEIIDYLFNKDVAIRVLTNGQNLVGNENRLANYYPFEVQFSVYSDSPEVHDQITRTKGSWKKTMNVMKKLNTLSVPLDIACPLMQPNLKSYRGIKRIADSLNATIGVDIKITDSIDGDTCATHHLRLNPEQLEAVLMDDIVLMHTTISEINEINTKHDIVPDGAPCNAAINAFCINPNGNLTPCCTFHYVLGNLKKESFRDIVVDNNYIKWWKNLKVSQYEECYTHDYCDYCVMCAGNNFNETGDILKAGENNCYIAKARHSFAMKIKAGEDILGGKTLDERIKELKITEPLLKREYRAKMDPAIHHNNNFKTS